MLNKMNLAKDLETLLNNQVPNRDVEKMGEMN